MIPRRPVGRVIVRSLSYKQILLSEPYEPALVEVQSRLYEDWNKRGLFNPDTQPSRPGARPFVMCLPPPNVTGDLHIGHTLAFAIEDALGRWHRMHGHPVLLLPGTDHAGIATQAVVERQLAKRRTSRLQLGRDRFVQEVQAWSEEKQRTIRHQIERVGVSADWSRQFFTLDPPRSAAVIEAFRRLHASDRIVRGRRIVNYCSALRSVISDIEVESHAVDGPEKLQVPGFGQVPVGRLHLFSYRLEPQTSSGEQEEIVVATTRLETMLGDTAIAVHPSDSRYGHLIGRRVLHPFLPERRLPIVADDTVDPDTGTGAVKVTPAHSEPDLLIGQRHNLDIINILNDDGSLNASVGEQFQGLSRFAARSAVQVGLEQLGLYRGWRPHAQVLPLCSRTGDLVEPLLRPQWFLRCSGEMSARALDAVTSGELCIRPANYVALWEEWMSKCKDWCISRQLWWGHRIPAWQNTENGEWRVPLDSEEQRYFEESEEWQQDEDVLDTWFSSALLPFSALGWPVAQSPDLAAFFPNTALETGVDILFFWVARMVMLGLELSGQLPFKEVVLHGLVCDRAGQKMSKSKGNVVDPLTILDGTGKLQLPVRALGADALRSCLLAFNTRALHLNFDEQEVFKARKFGNKVWNSVRLVVANLQPGNHLGAAALSQLRAECLPPVDRWILYQMTDLVSVCENAFQTRQLHVVVKAITEFWLEILSPVFLEVVKPRLHPSADEESRRASEQVVFLVCDVLLRLLHPIMPFLTEFTWRALLELRPGPQESLAVASYPRPQDFSHFASIPTGELAAVEASLAACHAVRSWRTRLQVPRADLRNSIAFECNDPLLFQIGAPLADALCRVPLIFRQELPLVPREQVLELPLGPSARLLVQRNKAKPEELQQQLKRALEKLQKEEAALASDANSYHVGKVRKRIQEVDSDLTLLAASMRV